jgi:hypothetical protein
MTVQLVQEDPEDQFDYEHSDDQHVNDSLC